MNCNKNKNKGNACILTTLVIDDDKSTTSIFLGTCGCWEDPDLRAPFFLLFKGKRCLTMHRKE